MKLYMEEMIWQNIVKNKEILYMAKCEDLPLRKLVNPQFTVNELLAVLDGLRDGLDVALYADNKYNYLQMITIMEGLSEGLDVTPILDHYYYMERNGSSSRLYKRRI